MPDDILDDENSPKPKKPSAAKKATSPKSPAKKPAAKKSAQDKPKAAKSSEKTVSEAASTSQNSSSQNSSAQYDGGQPMEFNEWLKPSYKNVQLNYGLYLLSFLFGPIALVGLILALINKDSTNDILKTHYIYQIRTFWIGLLIMVIGFITVFFFIGFLILLAGAIWFIIRSVKGLIRVSNGQPIEDPKTWAW